MQGPVYGLSTPESDQDERLLPNFHYDDIFGTVVNRFLVQAVAGVPLTIYGQGGQIRGYLNLQDTLQCVELAMVHPAERGQLRILNQFTELFSVSELAEKVQKVGERLGLKVQVKHIDNPRKEREEHYYNPKHRGFLDLGLRPHPMTEEVVAQMLTQVRQYQDRIDTRKIMPRVRWN
jgi:UDP-sulfoquinovose synthase